jgi:tryptophan synthase alpha subunit
MLPAGMAEEEFEPGFSVSLRRQISLLLSTGTSIDGTVLVSGPAGHERLSDYARASKQFWYILTSRGTVIVNSEHIVELVEKGNE